MSFPRSLLAALVGMTHWWRVSSLHWRPSLRSRALMGRASGGASSGGFSGTRVSDGELDSLDRIEGVDFGFGGTAAVVSAAVRMNRLDLLDRLYERGETGSRLLLCLTACRAAVYGVAPNH